MLSTESDKNDENGSIESDGGNDENGSIESDGGNDENESIESDNGNDENESIESDDGIGPSTLCRIFSRHDDLQLSDILVDFEPGKHPTVKPNSPIKSRLKPFYKVGSVRVLFITSNEHLFVCGPHWPFAFVMLLLHVGVASAVSTYLLIQAPFSTHCVAAPIAFTTSITLFLVTVVKDPGILFRSSSSLNGSPLSPTLSCRHTLKNRTSYRSVRQYDGHYDVVIVGQGQEGLQLSTKQEAREQHPLKGHETKQSMKGRWCRICEMIVPPKSDHCIDCGVCIDQYDHHCPWTGKCIGSGNIAFFYSWLLSIVIAIVYIGVLGAILTSDIQNPDDHSTSNRLTILKTSS